MFSITQGKGFQITFDNGYTVSVQWGKGNYCPNRYGTHGADSAGAETAVMYGDGFVSVDGGDVQGWQTPKEVAKLIARVSKLRKPPANKIPVLINTHWWKWW